MPRIDRPRRTALRLCALAVAGLAGCTTEAPETDTLGDTASDIPDDTTTDGTDDTATDPSGTAEPTGTAAELDLREANVTAVEIEPASGGDGTYRFSVTLYHDDDGEDGYANWWQVETLDGERLGRRELLHAHSTAPFTRSETVEIPDEVSCVVVRGHDQTHEYGGRAMVVTLDTGTTRGVEQGSDPQSFSDAECP